MSDCPDCKAKDAEIARLHGKMPATADSVSVMPMTDTVFIVRFCPKSAVFAALRWKRFGGVWHASDDYGDHWTPTSCCYSTSKAAWEHINEELNKSRKRILKEIEKVKEKD